MKSKWFQIALLVALVVILLNSAVVMAYPGHLPIVDPVPSACRPALDRAYRLAASVDIPAHRGEYAVLDRLSNCLAVSGVNNVASSDRYTEFKELQADQMMGK